MRLIDFLLYVQVLLQVCIRS